MIGCEFSLSPVCCGIVPVLIDPSTAQSSLSPFIPTIGLQDNSQVFHSDSLLFCVQLKSGCSVVVLFQLRLGARSYQHWQPCDLPTVTQDIFWYQKWPLLWVFGLCGFCARCRRCVRHRSKKEQPAERVFTNRETLRSPAIHPSDIRWYLYR